MGENNTLKILKKAVLLEKRGESFYRKVAEETSHEGVREFFRLMADEEAGHIQILSEQYRAYKESGRFKIGKFLETSPEDTISDILNQEIQGKIASAGFESAAIGAAIAMENQAVETYAGQAAASEHPEEKKVYQWLADWERCHLDLLLKMDKELTEKIWNDNQFWPF